MECYRRGYYAKEFEWDSSIDIYSPEATAQIYQMCSDYLRSFVWVCEYYIHGLPDWGWAYEYHYAPLMHDFSVYVNTISGEEFDRISHFEIHQPSRAFEQLLSILPPTSSALLPKIYRKLMLHPESPLVQAGYYTTDFKIDYEGKLKEFQGVAHLPFVDYAVVHSAYSKMNQCCVSDPEKFRRNRRGKVYYFSFDPEYHAQYSSGYGKIDDLQVRRREL
jgi:5'-3' exonuclease